MPSKCAVAFVHVIEVVVLRLGPAKVTSQMSSSRLRISSDSARAGLKGTQFRAENIEIGEEITGRGHAIIRMKSARDKRVCEYCVAAVCM